MQHGLYTIAELLVFQIMKFRKLPNVAPLLETEIHNK